jgi:hypothetical protein
VASLLSLACRTDSDLLRYKTNLNKKLHLRIFLLPRFILAINIRNSNPMRRFVEKINFILLFFCPIEKRIA